MSIIPGKSFCLLGFKVHICKMIFHSAVPNPLGAFLSTLGGISGPPRAIWLTWSRYTPCPLCPRPASFCSVLQGNSFHSRPVHGLFRHLEHLSCIPFPRLSCHLGTKTRFCLFSLLRFYSPPSEYLSQVIIIYSIACLLHLFLQPKMSWASAPGHSHRSKPWRIYWWMRTRSLFSWSLVSGGKNRQVNIQSRSKEPTRKLLNCNHPWAEQHT